MTEAAVELDCYSAYICLREPNKSEDKAEEANVSIKEAKENRIGASPVIGCQRPCMGVAICLSIDQEELLGEHRGFKAGGQKGRGSDNKSKGAQLPKSQVSVRMKMDSEDPQCGKGESTNHEERDEKYEATDNSSMGMAAPWYRKSETSVESSIPCSHGGRVLVVKGVKKVENAEVNSKYKDKAEGQRLKNFIRSMLMGFSSR
ncbi:hypothetical protein B296_00021509 [Ensete ventricosum]|uniref:Uncharacterized protein n=1 Tax=Ensete ventricosum TaxID=4639 RepID=A0A426Z2R9_ENSVE|nr:hypothetical protein B296_00021509 [Ensete ventricosum]